MGFATHLGPWLLGTVKETTGTTAGNIRNTGATIVSQTATIPATAMTTGGVATTLFTLPAGAKILRFNVEVTTAITVSASMALTIGTAATANLYVTSISTGLTVGKVAQATVDTAMQVVQTNNIGATDVIITGTTTAGTTNAGAGVLTVTVEYIVRAADGSAFPASA